MEDTDDAILAEASPYDKVWGIGMVVSHANFLKPHLWKGRNLLGHAIMNVRKRLNGEVASGASGAVSK